MNYDETNRLIKGCAIDERKGETGEDRPAKYGLCSKCAHFGWRRAKYMDEVVWCGADECDHVRRPLKPNCVDPVVDCADYSPAGQRSLYEMMQMAWCIDVEEKKQQIGFKKEEIVRKVTITKPGEKDEEWGPSRL